MRSSTTRLAGLICPLLFLLTFTSYGQTSFTLDYLEKTEDRQISINWRIEEKKGDSILTVTKSNGQTYACRQDASGAVRQWHLTDPSQETDITARRSGDRILIQGRFQGKDVNKTIDIDGDPWYQSVSFGLTKFAASHDRSVTFWALRTDTLSPHKMRALKTGGQTLAFQGKDIEAQKIRVKLTGLKAMFWHSDYWFKKDTGLFLKYEGVEGPPGTPPTLIELTSLLP